MVHNVYLVFDEKKRFQEVVLLRQRRDRYRVLETGERSTRPNTKYLFRWNLLESAGYRVLQLNQEDLNSDDFKIV